MTEVAAAREIYRLLQDLEVVGTLPAEASSDRRLEAADGTSIQCRRRAGADGSQELVLISLDETVSDARSSPNPMLVLGVFPGMASAEVRQLVHNGDFKLEPAGPKGQVHPLARRLAFAYARRWLGRLVAEGYRLRSADSDAASHSIRTGSLNG